MEKLNILMIGWEFPPYNSGGLGVASQKIADSLVLSGHRLSLVLPIKLPVKSNLYPIYFANKYSKIEKNKNFLGSYGDLFDFKKNTYTKNNNQDGLDITYQTKKYALAIKKLLDKDLKEKFDLIHCHDWLTVEAGLIAKDFFKIPMILHIHATEFDRTGGNNGNFIIEHIEKIGMEKSDHIISVSDYTKEIIINRYKIDPKKITTIHNGIDKEDTADIIGHFPLLEEMKKSGKKIILFLGRLTIQKGVEYLLEALPVVFKFEPNTVCVIAGSGDYENKLIDLSLNLGISDKVFFTGFVRGKDRQSILSLADVFVVPSVSEPFGLTPLEAAFYEIPVILSKQSGAKEVLKNSFLIDFWDKQKISEQIIQLIRYKGLKETMTKNALDDAKNNSWATKARDFFNLYCKIKK